MLISVIIPTKNRKELLYRAIKSINNQVCNSKIEIVVVNDCSKDGTYEFLEKIKLHNKFFKILHNTTPYGAGKSRNLGVNISSGQYIAFLDDDDEWLPNKIAFQEKFIPKHTFIATKYHSVSSNKPQKNLLIKSKECEVFFKPSFRDIFSHSSKFSPSSVIMLKNNFLAIGGFDINLKANQGRDLFIRYFLKYGGPIVINCKLVLQNQQHSQPRISDNYINRIIAHQSIYSKYKSKLTKIEKRDAKRNILLLKLRAESRFNQIKLVVKIIFLLSKKYYIQDCKKIISALIKKNDNSRIEQ